MPSPPNNNSEGGIYTNNKKIMLRRLSWWRFRRRRPWSLRQPCWGPCRCRRTGGRPWRSGPAERSGWRGCSPGRPSRTRWSEIGEYEWVLAFGRFCLIVVERELSTPRSKAFSFDSGETRVYHQCFRSSIAFIVIQRLTL